MEFNVAAIFSPHEKWHFPSNADIPIFSQGTNSISVCFCVWYLNTCIHPYINAHRKTAEEKCTPCLGSTPLVYICRVFRLSWENHFSFFLSFYLSPSSDAASSQGKALVSVGKYCIAWDFTLRFDSISLTRPLSKCPVNRLFRLIQVRY